jgi:hypothetical protein
MSPFSGDNIHRPALYLKHNDTETGFSLSLLKTEIDFSARNFVF